MSDKNWSVKIPLETSVDDVGYKAETNFSETVKYNIKSTLLTCPGEILSEPDFGVCLRKIIFENPTPSVIQKLKLNIHSQIREYMPYLKLIKSQIVFTPDMNGLNIRLAYRISESQSVETFETSIDLTKI